MTKVNNLINGLILLKSIAKNNDVDVYTATHPQGGFVVLLMRDDEEENWEESLETTEWKQNEFQQELREELDDLEENVAAAKNDELSDAEKRLIAWGWERTAWDVWYFECDCKEVKIYE